MPQLKKINPCILMLTLRFLSLRCKNIAITLFVSITTSTLDFFHSTTASTLHLHLPLPLAVVALKIGLAGIYLMLTSIEINSKSLPYKSFKQGLILVR